VEGHEVAGVVLGVHAVLLGEGEDLEPVLLASEVCEHPLGGKLIEPPAIEGEGHALAVAEALTLGLVPDHCVGERCVLGAADLDGVLAELEDEGGERLGESLGAHAATALAMGASRLPHERPVGVTVTRR